MVLDFLWPFQRKFSEIPAAREASIAAMIGGPIVGTLAFMATNKKKHILFTSGYAGIAIFWIAFIKMRLSHDLDTNLQKKVDGTYISDDSSDS